MNFIIALAIIAYLAIGCFIAGFINVDPRNSGEFMPFCGTLFLWPVAITIMVAFVVFGYPVLLGKKLGVKYLERFENFFDKIIDGEVE